MEDIEVAVPFGMKGEFAVLESVVIEMLLLNISEREDMEKFINNMQKKFKCSFGYPEVLYAYRVLSKRNNIQYEKKYEILLQKKTSRSQSGVMVFTVVTSPYPNGQEFSCAYDCKYCPLQPGQPRSYLKEEPGVSRANRHNFDPVMQIRDRAFSYLVNGHPVDKAEVIVLGGTWSSYPKDYQEDFITKVYYAANTFFDDIKVENLRNVSVLKEEIKMNENAKLRIIGLTLETRPDCINPSELKRFREFGVTRIQMGVQHTDNRMLERVNRGCTTEHTINAIRMLRDCCFKVDIHLMPDLPKPLKLGVDPKEEKLDKSDIDWDYDVYESDKKMFDKVWYHPDFQIDQCKIYTTEVTPYTVLMDEFNRGLHIPYSTEVIENSFVYQNKNRKSTQQWSKLHELLIYAKTHVPKNVRLNRIIRDIPHQYIFGGMCDVSARQTLQNEMKRRGLICKCIRCREVKKQKINPSEAVLMTYKFDSSKGVEYFLSFETPDESILFGFLRLRLSKNSGKMIIINDNEIALSKTIFPELENVALIRELHVYGQTTSVRRNGDENDGSQHQQHMGFGTKLLQEAFRIAQNEGYEKIAVISGVGVKNYYRKFGFEDDGNFMIKTFHQKELLNSNDCYFDQYSIDDQIAGMIIVLSVFVVLIGIVLSLFCTF
jgi:ELP3 family radical SAM enzyme/protein acetyltransferase